VHPQKSPPAFVPRREVRNTIGFEHFGHNGSDEDLEAAMGCTWEGGGAARADCRAACAY